MAETTADIERGRGALARRAWIEAYDLLVDAPVSELTGRELYDLADAAWWTMHLVEAIGIRQKAYSASVAEGNEIQAGGTALRLAIEHFSRGEPSVGAGWLGRAHRHLDGKPDCPEVGFLPVIESTVARYGGDLDGSVALATRAVEIAERVRDSNLTAMATHTLGVALVAIGRIEDGMRLLDESMTAAIAGEVDDYYAGVLYCNMVDTCLQIADVRRAGEWSQAATAWCDSLQDGAIYPGLCRVNRAEVAALRGAWEQAEAEALRAVDEIRAFAPDGAAAALYHVGEIRRRRGDLAGAEEAFGTAADLGHEPQPGLALLRFAEGKVEAARRALAHDPPPGLAPLRRAQRLAARLELAIADGDLHDARGAAEAVEALAAGYPTPALEAERLATRGALTLAEGRAEEAVGMLRDGFTKWRELKLPYESALVRAELGRALLACGDEEAGAGTIRSAATALEELGAVPDARRVERSLPAERDVALPSGLTAREADVLRLVAAGKTNREIATELFISEHTVARHLQNMFGKLGVSTRSAATAFAFEHGLA
ncbi:MAG: LuxR C-terminal-related transcriptional regulator [Actinomycetota bacterium]